MAPPYMTRYQPATTPRGSTGPCRRPEEARDTGWGRPLRHGTEPHDIRGYPTGQNRQPSCEFHRHPSHEGDMTEGAPPLQPRGGPANNERSDVSPGGHQNGQPSRTRKDVAGPTKGAPPGGTNYSILIMAFWQSPYDDGHDIFSPDDPL
jgi:hypothetical protein